MSVADDVRPTGMRLTDDQRIAWLRLIRSDNIGPATFRELLNHFGSASAAIEAVPELAQRGGRAIRVSPVGDAEHEIAALERLGGRLVAIGEPDYPPWLRHIDSAPPLISVRGDTAIFTRPTVAIVGSRNASIAGVKFAKQIARDLGERGYLIASGLARGIDAAAHEASISTGTVAVLAGGLDRIYPPDNTDLAEMIVTRGGAHVSEMPIGWEPRARDFPRRNRIVSGVALGVIVVEAAARSGSLITARFAAEQGRIVFAVPGSPLDPRATGANRLIRDGARIITSVDDIVTEIEPMVGRDIEIPPYIEASEPDNGSHPADAEDNDRTRIVDALGPAPVEMDEIIRFTGLKPAIVHLVLLELDLAGRIARHPGGRISLILSPSDGSRSNDDR
jgi:DNA processing protein